MHCALDALRDANIRAMARAALVLALGLAAIGWSGCGASHGIVLHAPEHRNLAAGDAAAGEAVICVTHKRRIRGTLPAEESSQSQASLDYDGPTGGALSISETTGGGVSITCD
jgi:hypothetical protein